MFEGFICARLEKRIKAQLDHKSVGVRVFDRIDSTNSEAKRLVALARQRDLYDSALFYR